MAIAFETAALPSRVCLAGSASAGFPTVIARWRRERSLNTGMDRNSGTWRIPSTSLGRLMVRSNTSSMRNARTRPPINPPATAITMFLNSFPKSRYGGEGDWTGLMLVFWRSPKFALNLDWLILCSTNACSFSTAARRRSKSADSPSTSSIFFNSPRINVS